jgi:hypothetical protein
MLPEELFKIRKSIILDKAQKKSANERALNEIIDNFECPIKNRRLNKEEKVFLSNAILPEIRYFDRKNDDKVILKRGVSLVDPREHKEWKVDKNNRYYWPRLEAYLKREFIDRIGDPIKAADLISSLDLETEDTLLSMENPKRDKFDWKGLVIGYVQSGKTANFTALAAKAADSGYNLIIIFAGLWDSLRQQTQIRMDRELTGVNDLNLSVTFIDTPTDLNKKWKRLTRAGYLDSNARGEFNLTNIESPNDLFGPASFPPLLVVMKKNPAIIAKFRKWLKNGSNAKKYISALIIDDEADQASIDTQNKKSELKKAAATNSRIRELLSDFDRKAYIGYTATPFANVLISYNKKSQDGLPDLYPRNYIHFLPKAEGYFGTAEMFGDKNFNLFVKETLDSPSAVIKLAKKKQITEDIENAINYFILSSGVRIFRGQDKKAMSMLIHVSHIINDMTIMFSAVENYFETLKTRVKISKTKTEYLRELKAIYESGPNSFTDRMKKVNTQFNFTNNKIPTFEEIKKFIIDFIEDIELRELNSKSEDKLDYAKHSDIKVIAIGGNQLSRGLTLEGLSTSYYLRDSRQNDTLLQMARWFGYRTNYEDVVTLFTSKTIREHFEYLAEVETNLGEEVKIYKEDDITPSEYAPRILDHARMNVTSINKMGAASSVDVSFSDAIVDVTWVALNNKQILKDNLEIAGTLIQEIGSNFKKEKGSHIATDVKSATVINFLENYNHPLVNGKIDKRMVHLVPYIKRKISDDKELLKWDVVFIGNQKPVGKKSEIDWLVFKKFNLVSRTRREKEGHSDNGNYNLGSVSTSGDRRLLLKKPTDPIVKPLLLVYRINKNSAPDKLSQSRQPLFKNINDKVDVLAFSVIFPKTNNSKDRIGYIQQVIEN